MVPASWSTVLDEARPLAERFAAAGHRLYLVGGAVRDLVAGRTVDLVDLDFTTDARPAEIRAVLEGSVDALWAQGERFGTVAARVDGRQVEVTTHRSEAYVADSRKPVVAFSDDVVVDLSRRDFTVNAMAILLTDPEPTLIDPFGGGRDLAEGRLRTPLAPEVSFSDDPLRMLRAARFVAGHGLEPVPELVSAATALVDRLGIVSVERIRDELHKLVLLDDPGPGVELLARTGLLARPLPEVAALVAADRDARVAAVAAAPRRGRATDLEVRLAALLGASPPATVASRLRALRHANATTAAVVALVELAPRLVAVAAEGDLADGSVRRVVHAAGDRYGAVLDLARALARAGVDPPDATVRLDRFEQRRHELEQAGELADLASPLDGEQVVAHLGIEPGPLVGAALDHLLDLRLDGGATDRAGALAALERWWAERSAAEATGDGA